MKRFPPRTRQPRNVFPLFRAFQQFVIFLNRQNHGNGLATRYGHLSEIDVRVGQSIRIGQVVGRIGSTGRSTGPHLHYETRVDGEAVDPQKFLKAGAALFGG